MVAEDARGSDARGRGVGAPPGWFEDPWGWNGLRWWDGSRWTGHTTAVPDGADVPAAGDGAAAPGREPLNASERFAVWVVILVGAAVLVVAVVLELSFATSAHATALVVRQGPCVTTTDAGLVCDEHVVFHDGTVVRRAVMHGVHPDEVRGPPTHRTLAIVFEPGDTGPPSTDDMPFGVPLGLGIGGALLLVWGVLMLTRRVRTPHTFGL